MNFKLIFLFLILVSACGVKGPPTAPKGNTLPSFMRNYPDTRIDNEQSVEKAFR